MMLSKLLASFSITAFLISLSACPPPGGDDGSGGSELVDATWEEEDDDTNGFPTDAEPVDVSWTGSVTIEGTMEDCGYDSEENWPWTGDEDNFRVEAPADGYLEVILTWDGSADLDLLVWYEPPSPGPGGSVSPDEQFTSSSDDGEINFLFPDEYGAGDEVVLGVLCAWGSETDYELRVTWED